METNEGAASSNKVRRDFLGGKRGDGDKRDRRIERGDPYSIRAGTPDQSLTGVAGLVPFGQFLQDQRVDEQLTQLFFRIKSGPLVIYPMETQIRLLIDANAVGEQRVFGLEALAADPLFVKLAGGVVPSIDTVYRDLCRIDEFGIAELEVLMAYHGLQDVERVEASRVHVDVDTTVEPLFGNQEGALPGPNPRYHGRPSYHPILATVAETGRCIGALLRPGDTSLGDDDAPVIGRYVRRLVEHVSGRSVVVMRADAGADCAKILADVDDAQALFIVKADLTPDLCGCLMHTTTWRTVDEDAAGRPITQVAELEFQRAAWDKLDKHFRVVAIRRRERDTGKQVMLWPDLDYSVQAFITNDRFSDPEDVAFEYDARAEIEPRIGDFKHGLGIGKVPSHDFIANHTMLLIKLLTHNLVTRYVQSQLPELSSWHMPWLVRVLFRVPGRLVHTARQWMLRLPPGSLLRRLLE